MDESPEDGVEETEQAGGGLNLEVVRSYLRFAKEAIQRRKLLIAAVALVGFTITGVVAKYIPRSYTCETVMMTVSSGVLDPDRGTQPLAGAEGLIMSHDNLAKLIEATDLRKKYVARRPPINALKDRLVAAVFGPMDDDVLNAVLVGTLASRLTVTVERETLTIDVDWTDGETAADIAEAAREGFLRMRHTAEMSAFQDKMAIFDSHAAAMRAEVSSLAQDMKKSLAEKRAELEEQAAKGKPPADVRRPVATRVTRRTITDGQLPELRQELATLKQKLSSAEGERAARVSAEQAKLDELMIRLTPSHPQVIAQQERVGMVSQGSSELSLMRSEVSDLESRIRQREAMQHTASTVVTTGSGDTVGSEPLPTEILGLLDERDADPALAAQMSGAIVRYGSLRDEIRGAKLALDTAQAAFGRRYQVTVPAEAPKQPVKPKVPNIIGAGAALSLLLAFLLPILLEVRRDVVVERWQLNQFQFPVLAELRLPSKSKDGGA